VTPRTARKLIQLSVLYIYCFPPPVSFETTFLERTLNFLWNKTRKARCDVDNSLLTVILDVMEEVWIMEQG
jgi:hypothetical protein